MLLLNKVMHIKYTLRTYRNYNDFIYGSIQQQHMNNGTFTTTGLLKKTKTRAKYQETYIVGK